MNEPNLAGKSRMHNLFFEPETGNVDFATVLRDVQKYISAHYSGLLTDRTSEETKEQIKRYISKYLLDNRVAVKDMSSVQLTNKLYTEMAEFSFLTKYIYGNNIEEININSWRDIEVQYANGTGQKLAEHFESPEHAVNVVRRMLHVSGMVLDNATPVATGSLASNIRIAAMKTPIVDENVGVCASIRIVNPSSLTRDDFVKEGTATENMLDFLSTCLRYGVSICVAGATSSGKTTLGGWLASTLPDNKRIFTIESGSRELDLVKENSGKIVNSVIHSITKISDNEKQEVDQNMLLQLALRFHPDYIIVGEMRSDEAYAAQEAARTGHTVMTTIHANSCEATWRRMVTLCKQAVNTDDNILMDLVTEAFPLVVFCKQLENKERRIMEIMECEILPNGDRKYNTVCRYKITDNHIENSRFVISGHHETVCRISESLKKRLLDNGLTHDQLENLLRGGETA